MQKVGAERSGQKAFGTASREKRAEVGTEG
jgi:hypothetical protein